MNMKLRILDKNNNELFVKQGLKIDCTYESEYSAGDKIYISANNCYFFKIQLDKMCIRDRYLSFQMLMNQEELHLSDKPRM